MGTQSCTCSGTSGMLTAMENRLHCIHVLDTIQNNSGVADQAIYFASIVQNQFMQYGPFQKKYQMFTWSTFKFHVFDSSPFFL